MDSQLFEIHTLLLSKGAKKYKIFVRHVNKKFYICVEKNYNQKHSKIFNNHGTTSTRNHNENRRFNQRFILRAIIFQYICKV